MQNQTRRTFIKTSALALSGFAIAPTLHAQTTSQIITVNGPIPAQEMGFTLPHEHIMSIFGGPIAHHAEYNKEQLFQVVIPYLKKLKKLGLNTLCECTAAYFGRRADLLQAISQETGINILTNTGYYGAANDRYLPAFVQTESVSQIAKRWITESESGIDGTKIHPGFIKIGVDGGKLSPVDTKLIQAAAQTHLHTGLTIAAHTSGNDEGAFEQLTHLQESGVHPSAWIWVHANNCKDTASLLKAAKAGAWIELDGIRENTLDHHVTVLNLMKENGYLNQVLLSHDGNSFRYGDRPFKPYESIFTHFIPQLKKSGYTQQEITQLTITNPSKAFVPQIRKV